MAAHTFASVLMRRGASRWLASTASRSGAGRTSPPPLNHHDPDPGANLELNLNPNRNLNPGLNPNPNLNPGPSPNPNLNLNPGPSPNPNPTPNQVTASGDTVWVHATGEIAKRDR